MDIKYTRLGRLFDDEASRLICMVKDSDKIDIADELPDGRLNHVIIRGTTTPVGYIGNKHLELVNAEDKSLLEYHNLLEELYGEIVGNLF